MGEIITLYKSCDNCKYRLMDTHDDICHNCIGCENWEMAEYFEPLELGYLLAKQSQLDNYIIRSKNLSLKDNERLNNTILAMMVELGELANEIRCFKFWSNKPSSDKEVIIDEYVDVLHFFLSIANQLGFTEQDIKEAYEKKNAENFARQDRGY